jgi:hypothetical protein
VKLIALLIATAFAPLALAQSQIAQSQGPAVDPRVATLLGKLPAPGNIHDVLLCAGANEVLWTETVRVNPYDRGANEAKRKAGWYAAVALGVFAVDSQAVIDAIAAAKKQTSREKLFEVARSCRAAPDSWRE